MLHVPLDAVLPAFLIALLGYVTGARLGLEKQTLSRIGLYILSPALIFKSLATSTVDVSSAWRLCVSTLAFPLVLAPLFSILFKALKLDAKTGRAMLLPTIFTNAGNYGLPVCLFAFGQEGMDLGAVFMVTQSILQATFGVYIAASSKMNAKTAALQVLKMPTVYALLAGLIVKVSGATLPPIVMRPVDLLAECAIGLFLVLLGLQLVGIKSRAEMWKPLSLSLLLRLVAAPTIAGAIGAVLGLKGLGWKILILQAAMPPPVNSTILAQEFDAKPELVSASTLAGTVASVVTLTLWIMILRAA